MIKREAEDSEPDITQKAQLVARLLNFCDRNRLIYLLITVTSLATSGITNRPPTAFTPFTRHSQV